MTLGSLFDGIGGFPLVAEWCGIETLWASEIEKAPIAITKKHFPNMQHLGDITKINGAEIPPVDIITFGSPCQDLSTAGKRKGLLHSDKGDEETTRSGLFMEAIRIAKEMRTATGGLYPTFLVWENVPGARSSNRGEDFRCVVEEFIRIKEPSDGERLTHNFGVSPNEERESMLSWILEDNVPEKYYLSPKACEGILRRAANRGKALPEILKKALQQMICRGNSTD